MDNYTNDFYNLIKVTYDHLKEEIGAVLLGLMIYVGKKFLKQTKNKIQVLMDVKDYTEINNILLRLNEQTNSDRVFLVRFNKEVTSTSIPITFDITTEVCQAGIKSTIDDRQEIEVNKYDDLITKFLSNDIYILNDISVLSGSAWAELETLGVKSHLLAPIKYKNKIQYGLGIEYVSNKHRFSNEDVQKVKQAILKISLILF